MEYVDVFSVVFNKDEKCFETSVNRNIGVDDYNEYNDAISVSVVPVKCKLNSVVITGTAGYLVTNENMSVLEGLNKVLNTFKEHCNSVIRNESDKLNYLEAVVL